MRRMASPLAPKARKRFALWSVTYLLASILPAAGCKLHVLPENTVFIRDGRALGFEKKNHMLHVSRIIYATSVSMPHIQLHLSRIATDPVDRSKDENIPNDGRPSVEAIRTCRICVGLFQAKKRVIVSVGQSLALAKHEKILAVPASAVLLSDELDRHGCRKRGWVGLDKKVGWRRRCCLDKARRDEHQLAIPRGAISCHLHQEIFWGVSGLWA